MVAYNARATNAVRVSQSSFQFPPHVSYRSKAMQCTTPKIGRAETSNAKWPQKRPLCDVAAACDGPLAWTSSHGCAVQRHWRLFFQAMPLACYCMRSREMIKGAAKKSLAVVMR